MRCNKYFTLILLQFVIYVCVWTSWAHIYEYLVLLCKIGFDIFDHPPTSPNTLWRQTPVFGSKISGSPVEREGWMITFSSFNISPSTWGNMFGHGSNSSRMTASVTGRTSRGSSSEISRGRMSTLVTPRTSRATSRSPASPYGITSVGSPNDATLHPPLKCIEITFMARIDVLVHLCEGQVLDLESSSEWVLVPL